MLFILGIIILSKFLGQDHTGVNAHSCIHEPPCPYMGRPEQFRVAIRGPHTVTISWRTNGSANGSNDTPVPQVIYSKTANMANSAISNGTSVSYTKLGIVSWFHNCIVNVTNSTRYFYRIEASTCVSQSNIYSFVSQPTTGDSRPINITIVGDIGFDTDKNDRAANKTIKALAEAANSTNFFLHVGDISYADDFVLDSYSDIFSVYELIWNQFQRDMENVTANNTYMTVPGNHEVTCIQSNDALCSQIDIWSQYRNFSAYLHRFWMPGGECQDSRRNLWYSFDYGMAHIVVINTETDFTSAPSGPSTDNNGTNFAPDGTQVAWLQADLEAANLRRCKVPWIIVAGHRPFYGSIPLVKPNDSNCDSCRKAFSQIIFENKVDFYFNGHVHWFERLYPVDSDGNLTAKNYTEPAGPIYVTTGAGGAPEPYQTPYINASASANIITGYGYSRLEIINSSYCELSFYESVNNTKIDQVSIFRTH